MEDKLASLIAENNLEISNVALSHNLTVNVLNNIKKNNQNLCDMEKMAMIRIVGKLNDLENMYTNYLKRSQLDVDVKKTFNAFIKFFHAQLQPFYAYNLYLRYEKSVQKDFQNIKEKINAATKNIPDSQKQIEMLRQSKLKDEFLTAEGKWKELRKGFTYEDKRINDLFKQYEYADYVFLLDSQIEKLENTLNKAFLPNDFAELLRSWYQRLNQLMEESIYSINENRRNCKNYCLKYGVVAKNKNKYETIGSLLQLFNPNVSILVAKDEIYISNPEVLNLPSGYTYNKEKDVIEAATWDKTVNLKVIHEYSNEKFLQSIRNNNPGAKIYLTMENGQNVLRCDQRIDQLKLPLGFAYLKDEATKEFKITNSMYTKENALNFKFKQINPKLEHHLPVFEVPKVTKREREEIKPIKKEEAPVEKKKEIPVKKEPELKEKVYADFSNKPTKVARHLSKEPKNENVRKAKGLLKISGHLAATSLLTITTGGAIIAQKVSKVISGLAKLTDMLTTKLSKVSKKAFSQEIDHSITELKALQKDAVDKANIIEQNMPKVPPQSNEQVFDLEDILQEFRGR